MRINSDYSIKVEQLIQAENKRFEEKESLIKENYEILMMQQQEKDDLELKVEEENTVEKEKKETLVKAVQALLNENGLLIEEKENATKNTPNSHQVG